VSNKKNVASKLKGNKGYIRYQIPTNARSKKLKKIKLGLIEFVILDCLGRLNIIIIRIGVKFKRW
jgi:hypothetical protein